MELTDLNEIGRTNWILVELLKYLMIVANELMREIDDQVFVEEKIDLKFIEREREVRKLRYIRKFLIDMPL